MTSTSTSGDNNDARCTLISDIIADVFISAKMYGICLPASLILMEQLRKLKLNPTLKCGQLKYEGRYGSIHVWVSVGDKIIDPTLKVTKTLGCTVPTDSDFLDYLTMDLAKFTYHPGEMPAVDEESAEMKRMLDYLKRTDNMIEEYFKMAPKKLNVIRNVINHKVERACCVDDK